MWGVNPPLWSLLLVSCDFISPDDFRCGDKKNLTKIVTNVPNTIQPIVRHACNKHGDARFKYLSLTEDNITKQKNTGKINYAEFAEKIRPIRWNRCRRCNGTFEETELVCCLEYYWLKDTRVSMRRSFLLHKDCTESELGFFTIQKKGERNMTLEQSLKV